MGEDEGDPLVPQGPNEEPEREIADAPASISPAALAHEAHTAYVEQLLKTVQVLEACESRMHALRAHVISALHEQVRRAASSRIEAAEAVSVTASEIAAVLNVGQRSARSLVDECLTLADPEFVPVLDALREGRLTRRQARAVLELAVVVSPGKRVPFCTAAVAVACPDDPSLAPSPGALGRRLRRLVEK
jgi:Asp-tRNA(Asn)/Glu-tRNA(Gln) amidotransferase B subunit